MKYYVPDGERLVASATAVTVADTDAVLASLPGTLGDLEPASSDEPLIDTLGRFAARGLARRRITRRGGCAVTVWERTPGGDARLARHG